MIRFILFLFIVGVSSFRIKRDLRCGIEASSNLIHHNPWVVHLEYWRDNVRSDNRCGASLIDCRHLITAAHCIKTPKFTRLVARLGEYDLSKKTDCVNDICSSPVVRLEVIEAVVHPDYNEIAHDVAVLKLETDAPYTDFIRPVCLPTGELKPDIVLVASGWGASPLKEPRGRKYYSTIKKIIPLPLWDKKVCVAAYKNFKIPEHVICAGGVEGVDTCRGDSGGPLVWVREKIELLGVTSAGKSKCGTKDSPGFYTNVADHMKWILIVIERLKRKEATGDYSIDGERILEFMHRS